MMNEASQSGCRRFRQPRESDGELDDRTVLLTGVTSLLGRLTLIELLARGCRVIALARPSSAMTIEGLSRSVIGCGPELPWDRVQLMRGDVWEPDLGLGPEILTLLEGVTDIIHLARPRASEEPLLGARVQGVDNVIELTRRLGTIRRVVVLSTIDVIGSYSGRFYEDWLDIGQELNTQRSRDLVEAEQRVREAAAHVPVCVVRHGALVGHSLTGQMECEAGFGRVLALGLQASKLPSFLRPPAPAEGKRYVSISPVDFVAAGLVEITFNETVRPGDTFCLADPQPPTLAEIFELVLDRVGGPSPGLRLPVEGRGPVGRTVELLARTGAVVTNAFGRGPGPFTMLINRGDHDVSNAKRVLESVGITCPRFATYLDALVEDYRRRHGR